MEGERDQVVVAVTGRAGDPVGEEDVSRGSPLGDQEEGGGDSAKPDNAPDTVDTPAEVTCSPKDQPSDAGTRQESVDVTYSQLAPGEPQLMTPVKRKVGRPRKQSLPVTPAPLLPPVLDSDGSPSTVRSSARPHKPPSIFSSTDETPPRRSSFSKKASSSKIKVAGFMSQEDLQREDDERQRKAGVARVYINPPGSSRAENSTKKILGRPRTSCIAVFKSDKLKDPEYLTKNIGSWTEIQVAIQTEQLLEAEAKKQAKAEAKAAAKLAAGEVKPKRTYSRKPKHSEPPQAPLTPISQHEVAAAANLESQVPNGFTAMPGSVNSITQPPAITQRPSTPLQHTSSISTSHHTPQNSSPFLPHAIPVVSNVYQRLYGNALSGQPRQYRSPFARPVDIPSSAGTTQAHSNSSHSVETTHQPTSVQNEPLLQPTPVNTSDSLDATASIRNEIGVTSSTPASSEPLPSVEGQDLAHDTPSPQDAPLLNGIQMQAQDTTVSTDGLEDTVHSTTTPAEPLPTNMQEAANKTPTPDTDITGPSAVAQSTTSMELPDPATITLELPLGDPGHLGPEPSQRGRGRGRGRGRPRGRGRGRGRGYSRGALNPSVPHLTTPNNRDLNTSVTPSQLARSDASMSPIPNEIGNSTALTRRASIASSPGSTRVTRSRVITTPVPHPQIDSSSSAQVTRSKASVSPAPNQTPDSTASNRKTSVASSTGSGRVTRSDVSISPAPGRAGDSRDTQPLENSKSVADDINISSTSAVSQEAIIPTPPVPAYQLPLQPRSETPEGFQDSESTVKIPLVLTKALSFGANATASYQSPYRSPYAPALSNQPQPEKTTLVVEGAQAGPIRSASTPTAESPKITLGHTSQCSTQAHTHTLKSSNTDMSATAVSPSFSLPSFLRASTPKPYASIYGMANASPTTYKSPYASSAGLPVSASTRADPVLLNPLVNGASSFPIQLQPPGQPSKNGANYPKAKRGRPRKQPRPETPQTESRSDNLPITPMQAANQQFSPSQPMQAYSAAFQAPLMSTGLPDFVKPVNTQPPTKPGDFFDEEHEHAVRSMTPQTPMSHPRPASSQRSLPDQTPLLNGTTQRRKSSLAAGNRRRGSSTAPPEQQFNANMLANLGVANDSSVHPVPSNPEHQQREVEEDLIAAESMEITDVAIRLPSVLDKVVGNLVLSEDKSQLRFIELHPDPVTPSPWTLSISDMYENPITSESRSKRVQLVLYKKTEDGKASYKFVVASTVVAQEAATNMRKELIKAKITADIQRRLKENILEQSNKVTGPVEVVKRFKCDTCGGSWLNREGVKYHKEHSKTRCNPNWIPPPPGKERVSRIKRGKFQDDRVLDGESAFLQLRQQAPLVLPNQETGAWDQIIISGHVPRRNARKRQKRVVIEEVADFDFSDEEDEEEVQVWEQATMLLPNPVTGAWDQPQAKPKKPSRRGGSKKAKNTKQRPVKAKNRTPDSDIELVVDDEDSGYEEWLEQQLASKKRRRLSTSSEDGDIFMPDFEERDTILDGNISGSDMDLDEPSTGMSLFPKYDESFASPRRKAGRQNQAKANSGRRKYTRKQPLDLLGTTPKPKYKWVNPKVKNPMTEEEKAAKRERAILRQQTWKQPITFIPNHQTGAWDQQPVIPVTYSRKGYSIQRKYRLPEPITYMQAEDSTWSFRPFGHGLRPIFTRPGRRSDGSLTLQKHLAKISAGPRPVLYPERRMFGPAPPSKLMLRDVARGYDIRDMSVSDKDPSVEPGNAGGSRKRKRRTRRSVIREDSELEGDDEIWYQVKRRRTSLQISTGDEDVERSNVLDPIKISSSRRLTRGLRAKISNVAQNLADVPTAKKLDPSVGRQINPGLNSLPPSFGLLSSGSVSDPDAIPTSNLIPDGLSTLMDKTIKGPGQADNQSENSSVAQSNHDQWLDRSSRDGSITLQGWWPSPKWLMENNMLAEFALQDTINQDISSVEGSTYIDHRSMSFESLVELISNWEQDVAKDFLLSSTLSPGARWVNHTIDWHEPSDQNYSDIRWLDANSFAVETIPYAELESVEQYVEEKQDEPVEPPAKRQKRGYVRKGSNAALPVRDTQKRYKNRHLTAFEADLEGVMESTGAAAAAFGVSVVPSPAVPAPRQRGNHLDVAMQPEVETRFIVAIVIMRTLIGGLELQIDWVLISQVFPEFSMNFLSKHWNKLLKGKSALIDRLGREFQEPFLKAYEANEIPPIDYDKLQDYDWNSLIDWTMQNVQLIVELKPQDLPATRERLEGMYELIEDAEPDKHHHYYSIFMPTYKRLEIISMYQNTRPSRVSPTIDKVDERTVARSWVRASQFTEDAVWDEEYGQSKLHALGEDLTMEALEELRVNKVLIHRNRRREMPGRPYEPTIGFSESFRKLLEEKQFIQAANFKTFLDAKFEDPDGEGRRYGVAVDWMADEGSIMCITNLQANGRIMLQASKVPMNKFGLTDGGYETRKLEKSRLRFDMHIFPTDTYMFTSEISEVHRLAKMTPPVAGDMDAIPVWCDIYQNVMEYMWRKVVTAMLGLVSTRSGIDLQGLKREMSPAMEGWEIILFLKWAEDVGAVKNCDEEVEGWVTDEWWWLIAGMVLSVG